MEKIALLFLLLILLTFVSEISFGQGQAPDNPNIVMIFADDLGYGDLGIYGHPTIRTPNLDQMATEGMKFTQFYAGASVCTPSRAALLTGRLPVRNGMMSDKPRVLFPFSAKGLPPKELTIAEALKTKGYATAHIGKWHLGDHSPYLPIDNGFDYYYGIPYSNDMDNEQRGYPPIPLMRNNEIIEQPADQHTLTKRYTEESINFIRDNAEQPFFLYLAHTFPHIPLYASEDFQGTSSRGPYGDVVEEMDWSVGQILNELRRNSLAENTLVFFTSDNGPWLTNWLKEKGGSAGLLRGGKGTTWEGGMREPAIAWWPGRIKAGEISQALATTMDLYATFLKMADVPLPSDRIIDGVDLMPVLINEKENVRELVFYYREARLSAVRKGPWKAHFITQSSDVQGVNQPVVHDSLLLYNLEIDPSEKYNVAEEHPKIIADIMAAVAKHEENLVRGEDQLAPRKKKSDIP